MTAVWLMALRTAIAASYLTLAVVANETARDLAFVYAALVLIVVLADWRHA